MVRTASLLASAAIPALLYLLYVSHYAVDAPNADDWNVIQLASNVVHHAEPLSDLWSQHGDTRIFVANLFFAAFGRFDHLNEKHIMFFSAGTYIATFVMLLFLFRSYLRRRLTFIPVLAFGVVWFSVADVQNSLWSFQMAWYLVVFFFVAMAYFLVSRRRYLKLFLALGIAAAVLASLTEVQGFVVWPVGLVCLLWASPWGRRTYYESAIWVLAAVLTTRIYLHNFNWAAATNICVGEGGQPKTCSLTYGLWHPVELAKFLSVLAGNVFPTLPGTYTQTHEVLGAAIWIAAGFVAVQSIRNRRTETNPLPALLIAFALQFDLMLALSRLGQGARGAGKNWYTMPNVILLSGIVVYASGHVPDLRKARGPGGGRKPLERFAFIALAAFLVVQCVVATQFGITNGRFQRKYATNIARVMVNLPAIPKTKQDCYFTSVVVGPSASQLYAILAVAQRDHLTLFRPGGSERYRAQGPPRIAQCDH
jgi:hypothetical protein